MIRHRELIPHPRFIVGPSKSPGRASIREVDVQRRKLAHFVSRRRVEAVAAVDASISMEEWSQTYSESLLAQRGAVVEECGFAAKSSWANKLFCKDNV